MAEFFQRDQGLFTDLFGLTLLQFLKPVNGKPTERFVRSRPRQGLKAVRDGSPRRETGTFPKLCQDC